MLRIGWKDALAYRTEMLVWMLTMTLPLVMLALFRTVAAEGDVAGFDGPAFTAYFLATLTVRQLASSWSIWEINRELREGALALRLLRPVHPLWAYHCDTLAAIPLRALISVPVALALLYAVEGTAGARVARDPATLGCFALSLARACGLAFCLSSTIGALALYLESALGVWHLYIGLYALLSGYLVPLALFPPWLRAIAARTPFPYLQAVPVEILLGHHAPAAAARLCAIQAAYLAAALATMLVLWRDAQRRFAAYGG
jgi:ABC-2 type transport system permease protein